MDPLLTKEIKSILEDVIDQKIGNLEKEVMGIKSTMTAQYLSSIGRFMEMEAVETVDDFACCFHEGVESNCKNSLRSWIKKYMTQHRRQVGVKFAFSVNNFDELRCSFLRFCC